MLYQITIRIQRDYWEHVTLRRQSLSRLCDLFTMLNDDGAEYELQVRPELPEPAGEKEGADGETE